MLFGHSTCIVSDLFWQDTDIHVLGWEWFGLMSLCAWFCCCCFVPFIPRRCLSSFRNRENDVVETSHYACGYVLADLYVHNNSISKYLNSMNRNAVHGHVGSPCKFLFHYSLSQCHGWRELNGQPTLAMQVMLIDYGHGLHFKSRYLVLSFAGCLVSGSLPLLALPCTVVVHATVNVLQFQVWGNASPNFFLLVSAKFEQYSTGSR